jgi:hypothetical protein
MPIEILVTMAIAFTVVFLALIGGDRWKRAKPAQGRAFFPPAVHALAFVVAMAAAIIAILRYGRKAR